VAGAGSIDLMFAVLFLLAFRASCRDATDIQTPG
jgi:hypothetical protein